jgi:DNA-binding cell septation regulator SpoVG
MEMEVSRIFKFNGDGPVKAMADVMIEGQLVIKGFKIINGKNGLFVGMPREQGRDGKWYSRVYTLADQTKDTLTETVLKAYGDENA